MGMSREQVIEAEEKNGFYPILKDDGDIRVEGAMASISDSSIAYWFEDNKLVRAFSFSVFIIPKILDIFQ